MKLLLVDSDLTLADVTAYTLRRAGFEIVTAHDGPTAAARWQAERPDLVLLDVDLPGTDGLTLCRRMRMRNTPVIILSAQSSDDDVVKGLEAGADDYIAKPFSPTQLVARVRSVLRRAGMTPLSGKLAHGDLTLDTARREVRRGTAAIALTQLECRLLEVLILNSGHVLPSDALIDHVWGIDGGDRVMLKQLIHRLRHKIEPDPSKPTYLENIPGVGYALIQDAATQ